MPVVNRSSFSPRVLIFRAEVCERQHKRLMCYRSSLSIKAHESLVPQRWELQLPKHTDSQTYTVMHVFTDTESQTHNHNQSVSFNPCCGHKVHTDNYFHILVRGWIGSRGGGVGTADCDDVITHLFETCRELLPYLKYVCNNAFI